MIINSLLRKLLFCYLNLYFICFYIVAGCGGKVKGEDGVITSPGFPGKYPNKRTCIWSIEVPTDKVVSFQFSMFDLEPHYFCKYDYLEIRDGWDDQSPQLGRYCTTRPPYGKFIIMTLL